jgi:hypothetical protein
MGPYPSCDILNPSKRQFFLEELERCQDHLPGRYPEMEIEKFEELCSDMNIFDALRCAITLHPLPEAGVYALWHKDEVVYIGRSFTSVLDRINAHRSTKLFDQISAIYANERDEEMRKSLVAIKESELIFALAPKYNRSLPCDFIEGPWWFADMGPKDELEYVPNGKYTMQVCFLSGRPYLLMSPDIDGSCSKFRLTHKKPDLMIPY